jgi:hypothetical protein
VFAYNVAETYLGSLLYSASGATTIDNSIRQHAKFDYSRFTYPDRSFGIGTSVGLMDDDLLDPFATEYTFQEKGYLPYVDCLYNKSSAYGLHDYDWMSADGTNIYIASGYLPNSNGRQEWARYPALNDSNGNAIMAIGVASVPDLVGRILGIAAGSQVRDWRNTFFILRSSMISLRDSFSVFQCPRNNVHGAIADESVIPVCFT